MTTRAVLLDALGTLVELEDPAPRLKEQLCFYGISVSDRQAEAAFAAEIAYYLAHHLEGRDEASVEDLRDRCAEHLRRALDVPALSPATARRAMVRALWFEPYDDVVPALRRLRELGLKLVIVSNWDASLPEWLHPLGLTDLVDATVTSAEVGAAKPDPRVFQRALEVADVDAGEAVHVGDSLDNDVQGARAAGIRPLLVARQGEPPPGVEAVRSLAEVASVI